MRLDNLESFFNKDIIPKSPERPITFLDIAKQPHYENVISNIYAFFFDIDGEHGFKDLFISSLIECINKKLIQKDFILSGEYEVFTEKSTDDKSRIDILLRGEENAIIIENKIYHYLNNPINEYWESITKEYIDPNLSVGVLLTLNKSKTKNDNFVNITHKELINQINKNIGKYHLDINIKYYIFLQDFQQNIHNLSAKKMNDKQLEIYLENQEEIEDAITLKKLYKEKVHDQVLAIEKEEFNKNKIIKLNTKHPKKISKHYKKITIFNSVKKNGLRLKISYEHLFDKEGYFEVIIDLDPFKKNIDFNKNLFKKKFNKIDLNVLKPSLEEQKKRVLASKTYKPDTNNKINLTKFIAKKLAEDNFLKIFKEAENYL